MYENYSLEELEQAVEYLKKELSDLDGDIEELEAIYDRTQVDVDILLDLIAIENNEMERE